MTKGTYTVLVVDDEWSNIVIMQKLLQKHGYHVLSAANSREGRDLARRHRPDLIFLDVVMPDEDGYEMCASLKKDPVTASIPVIFITARDDIESRLKGLTVGGLDYITKPFMKEEVLMRARNILRLNYSFQRVIDEQAARLRQVRDAQRAILPGPEDLPGAGFVVHYQPLLDAGGDFYDVYEIAEGVYDYFLADVSGHDLGASFATSALKALVQLNASNLLAPDETMRLINSVLHAILPEGQYMTAVYARLDRGAMSLLVVNAAHLPIVYRSPGGDCRLINADSDTLGAFADGVFACQEVPVAEGGRFLLYSDGLVETSSPRRNREEGVDVLRRTCRRTGELSLEEAVREIVAEMLPSDRQAEDDVVLLAVDI